MLLIIPKVYLQDGQEKTEDVLVNDDYIIRAEHLYSRDKGGISKSLILLDADHIFDREFRSTLTPEEIANMYYRARQIKLN